MTNVKKRVQYEVSYLGQLRKLVGKRKVMVVTLRAVIVDDEGRVLFIKREDNGVWAMPAGSLELNESVLDGLKREVMEETGLTVKAATLIAINSEPRFHFVTHFGDPYQMIGFVFRVDDWEGELVCQTDETNDACFFAPDDLPEGVPDHYYETLADLAAFEGVVILK